MNPEQILLCKKEARNHLLIELLPFRLNRGKDDINRGFITQFDKLAEKVG